MLSPVRDLVHGVITIIPEVWLRQVFLDRISSSLLRHGQSLLRWFFPSTLNFAGICKFFPALLGVFWKRRWASWVTIAEKITKGGTYVLWWKRHKQLYRNTTFKRNCVALVGEWTVKILFCYMEWSASRGFPLLRKAISLHVKNYQ